MYVSRREFHAALAALWEQMETFASAITRNEIALEKKMEKSMTDFSTALSDLDGALGDLENDVTNLQQQIAAGDQAATQAAAAQLEQRVSGIRNFLSQASGTTTPPAGGDTGTGTDTGAATGGDTSAPAPTEDSTDTGTPPASV